MGTVHIIGAGLSGLAAAVALVRQGRSVAVYESAGQAGGRCRSFYDKTLDREIDNGNHFLLSGNHAAFAYIDAIGARGEIIGPDKAAFPFVDVRTGARWTIDMNRGPVPYWIFDKSRRIPDTSLTDYLPMLRLALAGRETTVADVTGSEGVLYERFWEPMTLAVLNTTPENGQARLMWAVFRETFLKGADACALRVARNGLGKALVEPAVAMLSNAGAPVRFNRRLRSLSVEGDRVAALQFTDGDVEVGAGDAVILALPPSKLKGVLPDLDPPADEASIVNAHYRLRRQVSMPPGSPENCPLIGMLNSDAQWATVRGDLVSLTISAGHELGLDDVAADDLAPRLWAETQIALGLQNEPYEVARIIKEKRATFDQSPAGVAKRLEPRLDGVANLALAGDHTDTGLPATIESSIRSGNIAAAIAVGRGA
ncbi:MAG: hydroxysqualene dehydroxylase HpnE [Pseudomonadota bacterium]